MGNESNIAKCTCAHMHGSARQCRRPELTRVWPTYVYCSRYNLLGLQVLGVVHTFGLGVP